MHFILFLLTWFGATAEAKRDIDSFTNKLQEAGWTLNPLRGTTMTVGDIYSPEQQSPLLFGEDCFSLSPREGVYEGVEVIRILKAGLSLPIPGLMKLNAGANRTLEHSFIAPYVSEVAELALQPNQSCSNALNQTDVREAFVVTATLLAEVIEQDCIEVDAGVGGQVGGSAAVERNCTQESQGHVVVAYKSMPVNQLHLIEEVQEVEVTKTVQVDCRFEQVFVERSIVIINGEQFNLNKDEDSLLQTFERCGYTDAASTYLLWQNRRKKALLWTYTVVGVVHVAPWVAISANNSRIMFEEELQRLVAQQ